MLLNVIYFKTYEHRCRIFMTSYIMWSADLTMVTVTCNLKWALWYDFDCHTPRMSSRALNLSLVLFFSFLSLDITL